MMLPATASVLLNELYIPFTKNKYTHLAKSMKTYDQNSKFQELGQLSGQGSRLPTTQFIQH